MRHPLTPRTIYYSLRSSRCTTNLHASDLPFLYTSSSLFIFSWVCCCYLLPQLRIFTYLPPLKFTKIIYPFLLQQSVICILCFKYFCFYCIHCCPRNYVLVSTLLFFNLFFLPMHLHVCDLFYIINCTVLALPISKMIKVFKCCHKSSSNAT